MANPVLVGAVTVLITNVAVFLSWNANKGLPFVPTKQVQVQFANGANLLPGNEVREGGYRIGIVKDMKPRPLPGGGIGALVTLQIDEKQGRIPADTQVAIRPRSVLGLKYVEITARQQSDDPRRRRHDPGRATRTSPSTSTSSSTSSTSRRATARSKNLRGFGDAFASRGADLNRTIAEAPRLLALPRAGDARCSPDPATKLKRFFGELGDFTRVARTGRRPLRPQLHRRRRHLRGLVARTRRRCATRSPSPAPTMEAGTRSLRRQRPFLVALRDFSVALDDAARQLAAHAAADHPGARDRRAGAAALAAAQHQAAHDARPRSRTR